MLVSQVLFYTYGAFSPSPPREFYKQTTSRVAVNANASSPDPDFLKSLAAMELALTSQKSDDVEIREKLICLSLREQQLKRDLESVTQISEQHQASLKAKAQETTRIQSELEKVRLEVAALRERNVKTETSLERHKQAEQELTEQLAAQELQLQKSKIGVRILAGQNAMSDTTIETYVSEVATFFEAVKSIIKIYKEHAIDCKLLERLVKQFETDCDFTILADHVKKSYDTDDPTTVSLFNEKKGRIYTALSEMLKEILSRQGGA